MGTGRTVIHANPALSHQVEYAEALKKGFWRHGIGSVIGGVNTPGDLHVCIGPHFALNRWRGERILYLDRAYWGDPDCVSVHWLKDGEKVRTWGNPYRAHPDFKPYKVGSRSIYLCDYGEPAGEADTVRHHPAQRKTGQTLYEAIACHEVAIGRRTTALVEAAIMGLEVRTDDPHSPVYPIRNKTGDREQWLCDLAWHNWSLQEIENGDMWNAIGSSDRPD